MAHEREHARVDNNEVAGPESETGNRRSKAGGVLGALPFLQSSKTAASRLSKSNNGHAVDEEGAKSGPAIATAALPQSHGRKRTGSLRQAAMAKVREHIVVTPPIIATTMSTLSSDDAPTSRSVHENASLDSSPESEWLPGGNNSPFVLAASNSSLHQQIRPKSEQPTSSTNSSPEGPLAWTTDEDEAVSFHHPPTSSSRNSSHFTSEDPAMSTLRRRLTRAEPQDPVTTIPTPSDLDIEGEWDYSETEWWGWVILIATWIVFVVVMGSCFGVWSWAWDVGETPYAPPDLEDDDTLPITGYYPALMVCTAVMSWVWVVVAWVGMKYFRHS
jgi:hypothetical protein